MSWTTCCGQWSQWSTTCVVLCTVCQENERDGISHLCFITLYPNLVLIFLLVFLLLTLCSIALLQWFGNLFLMLKPCCTTLEILLPLETNKISGDNAVIVWSWPCCQTFPMPHSTDNYNNTVVRWYFSVALLCLDCKFHFLSLSTAKVSLCTPN